ncbi:apolipoprotein N-acyltransferase [Streptomyces nitrosporeus]|uniref:Apolipoprotein N-acyltransferase n=1 Tax=Streptomyces nitrosporeus TaxID=28894 RepID=A0A5J6FK05_9ACTN|nr:apolipoprotein N-acyltransferase [Streptomyces nitrosporeus]QEU75654.1 apolipoprotein N-acyltransferase [Streptomyces nitrosporeus]GGY86913.1 apolipoprotein N-acyltransferase [Streptomyces nitrosporeus]
MPMWFGRLRGDRSAGGAGAAPAVPGGRLRRVRAGRCAGALIAGALPALAFPAPSLWWLAYVALVPWLLLIASADTGRRAALDGWLGGTGFILAVHHWLMPSLHVFILVLAALLGLLWAPWGLLVSRALGGTPAPSRAVAAVAVVPSGWLMIELIRSWEGLGGPWGLLGASQWQSGPGLRTASVGGVWLVSLLVVAVNTAVALLLTRPAARTAAVACLAACAVGVAAVQVWAPAPSTAGTARIAVVQPGVISGPGSVERRFARSEELTRSLTDGADGSGESDGTFQAGEGRGTGEDIDLVVWGESSVGVDLTRSPATTGRLAALSREVGADILVNMDARRTDAPDRSGIFKSAVLVGPDGPTGDRYDKMRLVPFGEYVPARSVLGWATSVGKAAGEDRLRGDTPVVMDLPDADGLRIGPLVCFETAFPDMSRRLVLDGAQVLVAQSSTSTFQHSWAPAQHASLGALRAAESGRPMVHATLTGVSAVYGPRGGRVGPRIGTGASRALVYDVPLAVGTTLYVRLGAWPVYGALAVLAGYLGRAGLRRLGSPRREP